MPLPNPNVKSTLLVKSTSQGNIVSSEEKPNDVASPGKPKATSVLGGQNKEEKKVEGRQQTDQKIRDMIEESTTHAPFKPAAGTKLVVRPDTKSGVAGKIPAVVFGDKNKPLLNDEHKEEISQSLEKSTKMLAEPVGLKKTLSIRLKTRTANNSRSRLETSEDRPRRPESPSLQDMNTKKLASNEDSDDSGEAGVERKAPRLASEALDSMLRAPTGLVISLGRSSKAQTRTSVGGVRMLASHQDLEKDKKTDAQSYSTQSAAGQRGSELQPQVASTSEGVPQVLSRHKPRQPSLQLRKSLLPKPPSAMRI